MDKSKFNRFPQDSSQQEQFVDEAIDAINAAVKYGFDGEISFNLYDVIPAGPLANMELNTIRVLKTNHGILVAKRIQAGSPQGLMEITLYGDGFICYGAEDFKTGSSDTYDLDKYFLKEYYSGNVQWDTIPTEDSPKPVTSGGIYTYVDEIKGKLKPKYTIPETDQLDNDLQALIGNIENGDIISIENYLDSLFVVLHSTNSGYTLSVVCSDIDVSNGNDVYLGCINVHDDTVRDKMARIQVSTDSDNSILVYHTDDKSLHLEQPEFGTKLYRHRLYKEAPVYQQMTIIATASNFAGLADANAIVNIMNILPAGPGSAASITGAFVSFNVSTSSGDPVFSVSVLKNDGQTAVIQNVFSMFDATNDTITAL